MNPTDKRHGTTAGFHQGCRCPKCRAAIAAYEKRGRWHRHNNQPRAIPAIGAQRRIQGLMALGWSSEDIARAGNWHHRNAVLRILNGQKGKPCNWVERDTHKRVCDVFERLCMTVPEMNGYRKRCQTIALNKGYVVPLAWDDIDNDPAPHRAEPERLVDEVAIRRALDGDRSVRLRKPERIEAVRVWCEWGRPLTELERITGWNVHRYIEEGAA